MTFEQPKHEDLIKNIERAVRMVRSNTHRGGMSHILIYVNDSGVMCDSSEKIANVLFSPERLVQVKEECSRNPGKTLMIKVKL